MALTVGSVIAKFQADVSDFKKGLAEAKNEVGSLANSLDNAKVGSAIFTAAVTAGSVALGSYIKEATLTAARTQTLGIAMEQVAKATGNSFAVLKEQEAIMKKQGITTQEADTILTKFMQSELDVAQAADIARVAQDLAVIAGINSSEAAGQLTDAIAMQRPILLREFGIVQDLNDIFGDYADKLGISSTALTETQKKQAMINAIMEAGTKVAGAYEAAMGTAGKKLTSIKRYTEEAANAIGGVFLPALNSLIDAFTAFLKQVTPENVKAALDWIVTYGPIIAGIIIGGMVPALYALGVAFVAAMAPLIPFMLIGAAIGALITGIILAVRNWGAITEWFTGIFTIAKDWLAQTVTDLYETYILPIFTAIGAVFTWLWETIIKPVIDMIVAYYQMWYNVLSWVWNNLIYPILLLISAVFLRIFFEIYTWIKNNLEAAWAFWKAIFTTIWEWVKPWLEVLSAFINTIFTAIKDFIGAVWTWIKEHIISRLTEAKNSVVDIANSIYGFLRDKFEAAYNYVKDVWQRLKNAIIQPFEEAKRKVEEIANAIKNAAEAINPFHRESPSLVDNVRKGVEAIKDAYGSLGMDLNPVSVSGAGLGVGVGGSTVVINLDGANITSPEIAEEYAELIGDQIMRRLGRTTKS